MRGRPRDWPCGPARLGWAGRFALDEGWAARLGRLAELDPSLPSSPIAEPVAAETSSRWWSERRLSMGRWRSCDLCSHRGVATILSGE